ncbi:MAG: hypothetical protein GC165_17040 [Armatimonadetes bacterium]|nr:hypothetical protein [Armatimonadota bacterium]MBS1725163.1 hypothetical protein [Armatimonadota bacterium]
MAQEADLGASFSRVWFARGKPVSSKSEVNSFGIDQTQSSSSSVTLRTVPTEPLVGIEIKISALSLAIHENMKKNFLKVSEISKLLTDIVKNGTLGGVDSRGLFTIRRTDYEMAYTTPIRPFLSKDKKSIVLVLPSTKGTNQDEALSNSINASYEVTFELKYFMSPKKYVKVELAGDTIKHKDPLSLTGRGAVSASTDFAKQDTKLIDTGSPAATGQRTKFAITYKGVANSFQTAIFRGERSYYDFSLDGVLTELSHDKQSRISLGFAGVTNVWSIPGTISTRAVNIDTSQHARQQSVLYDIGYKWGDRRVDGKGFIPGDEVDDTMTINLGIQLGGIFFKRIEGVPDPDKLRRWVVRPRLTIAFKDLLKGDGGLLSLSGSGTLYAVSADLGGADTFNGYGEEFNVSLKFGPDNQQIAFTISGGRNRAQDFVKVAPTYSLGLAYKF